MPHTPGPWRRCGGQTPKYTAIYSPDGYIVFEMAHDEIEKGGQRIRCPDPETQYANAGLIAAATDLLAACKGNGSGLPYTTFPADLEQLAGEILSGHMPPGEWAQRLMQQAASLRRAIGLAEGTL